MGALVTVDRRFWRNRALDLCIGVTCGAIIAGLDYLQDGSMRSSVTLWGAAIVLALVILPLVRHTSSPRWTDEPRTRRYGG